ncbi:ABC transporter permease [Motiliproteus sp. SC1-56]|uniref:ABC transporter permease n=1 Tax=Motiliproteus sp. SC1-56 TaxID=2799565 RepID=UPI001A8D26D3|nr:ABC transporter permease [Motiliproteus sp. SC1-56]
MNETMLIIQAAILTIMGAATPLLFAALGELVVERSGVLNLGVEGMMLVGAVGAFAGAIVTGNTYIGVLIGGLCGTALALLHGFLTLSLLANQVATGLAVTLFGVGLSALIGADFVGTTVEPLPNLPVPLLSQLPLVGALLFDHNLLIYLSIALAAALAWFIYRTRGGLVLRAVGESPESAHALGYPVIGIRYLALLFGGLMAGLGGAYLSVVYTPMWSENMTAGRGWVALALVVFASWRPGRVLVGAYMFGAVTILQLHGQGLGLAIPSQFLSMLPYLATVLVLVLISRDQIKLRENSPASLGKPFRPSA